MTYQKDAIIRKRGEALVFCLFLSLMLMQTASGQTQRENFTQLPADKRLVEIRFEGDYQQLEELTKRFQAQRVRYDRPQLFMVVDQTQLQSLREEGYKPQVLDAEEFFEQLVRVEPSSDSLINRVKEIGGHMVQREESYVIFRVNIKQFRLMQREQIQVREIEEGELVPRFVEIAAPDESAVALVVSIGVDIFEARDGSIFGRAYDDQIESLTQHGLEVKILPAPTPPD